jgi:enterochelin esterase-like enzyme
MTLGLVLMVGQQPSVVRAAELVFRVTLDPQMAQAPIKGRLFVFLSTSAEREPRTGPNWFRPEPFFGSDVADFRPGTSRDIDKTADGYPDRLNKLKPDTYYVQALLDHDFYYQNHATGPGNFYSEVVKVRLDPAAGSVVELNLNKVVPEPRFRESRWLREVTVRSQLLEKFHGREVIERATVVLPASYDDEPERRYPVIYIIPGFGGTHRQLMQQYEVGPPQKNAGETEFIRVLLSGNCKWGHHVYADSATNGPRGQCLIQEMIPQIDAKFRTVPAATARFLNGHSSGGWSSLWLQVAYPDTFGGVWSTAPDPVDFRDYQQTDLYAIPSLSLYFDEKGNRRPIARRNGTPVLWYQDFGRMDDVLGRGGQLRSFEAVFSPLDEDGLPMKLWDRATGRVNPKVAVAWQKYDICLKLESNWQELAAKLQGKLHVTTGELDTFYLEGAVKKMAATLKKLGSDAEVQVVPGKDHSTVLTEETTRVMRRQMSDAFIKHHPEFDTTGGK